MAFALFRRRAHGDTIPALYGAIVAQARAPAFYADYGVPDTVDGRFDLIVLHLHLVLRRLRSEPEAVRDIGQALFDTFCTDMDHNLREMGISDMGVPRRMRAFGEAYYGRATTYDRALDAADDRELTEALARNVFGRAEHLSAWRLAAYVRRTEQMLAGQPGTAIAAGKLPFEAP
jgi:cytochrome b pre-mRNA-processing protein 3